MTDFSWVKQHPLILSQEEAQRRFQSHGIVFAPPQPGKARPQRPHHIGQPADGRFRIELIGPPEAVFKATMLCTSGPAYTAEQQRADLTLFLSVLLPAWAEGAAFIRANLAAAAEASYQDFHITLRANGRQSHTILGLTWQPG